MTLIQFDSRRSYPLSLTSVERLLHNIFESSTAMGFKVQGDELRFAADLLSQRGPDRG